MNKGKFSSQRRRVITSSKEVNRILGYIEKYGLTPVMLGEGQKYKSERSWMLAHNISALPLSQYIIISLKETKLEITTRYHDRPFTYGTPCTYIFDLNEDEIAEIRGYDTYRQLSRVLQVKEASEYHSEKVDSYYNHEKNAYACSASPIIDYNRTFERQELHDCYEYDINSAYSATLLKEIPDIANPIIANYPDMVKVKKGEIGFFIDDKLTMVRAGGEADIKFKLIPTPENFKNWILKQYKQKSTLTGRDKVKAKAMLNYPIGYLQKKNPFLRAYVVNSCNERIKSLLDDDSLFWNTDAIFSRKRRPDLEIGNEIGQFKEIKLSRLSYIGNTYQVNDDFPTWRHVSKHWIDIFEKIHGRKFNLLLDYDEKIPHTNKYRLNWTTLRLEKTDEEINMETESQK